MTDLNSDNNLFYGYLRMKKETVEYIINIVHPNLSRYSNFRKTISPEERLVVTLRFSDGCIEFKIHDKHYSVGNELEPGTKLVHYIRDYLHLKGTKFMCLEGGCGACIIIAKKIHPATKKEITFSVNSCLVPVFICHGWNMTTIEGIGNRNNGYNKLQTTLAAFNGSQCGFCSPGMVMSMYSTYVLKEGKVTARDVENSFSGNICRCTGYRQILNGFQSLVTDDNDDNYSKHLKQKVIDIEDLTESCSKNGNGLVCGKGKRKTVDYDSGTLVKKSFRIRLRDGRVWYKVQTVDQIFQVYDTLDDDQTYTLVAGHTAFGVYRTENTGDVHIDINDVPELHQYAINDDKLELGANMTLADAIDVFRSVAVSNPDPFGYLTNLADHLELVANTPVRNIGTLAGNLSIKYNNREFASDVFVILEAADAQLTIGDKSGITDTYSLQAYLSMNMRYKVIRSIIIPGYSSSDYIYRSFKITQRALNTSAYVNSAFRIRIDKSEQYKVMEQPSLVFGGINDSFVHAKETEEYLYGKNISDSNTVNVACMKLLAEVEPNANPPLASPRYRRILAVSLFYKFILGLIPEAVSSRNKSGATLLSRPVSSGKENVQTDPSVWPITKPMPKVDAILQCAGEAEYTNDILPSPTELYAALVICDRGPGNISSVDPSEALSIPGVLKFISAKDIPGKNQITTLQESEQLLATDKVQYAGARIGVIIAISAELAKEAASKVNIVIVMSGKPVINLKQLVESEPTSSRLMLQDEIKAKTKKTDVKYKINGTYVTGGQYHFHFELQTCLCCPSDIGFNVYSSTQHVAFVQQSISDVLNVSQNLVNVQVKRLGGGFGGKLSNSTKTAAACALAAYCMKVPVRLVVPIETSMEALGKRNPFYGRYEVGVNDNGEIQYLNADVYSDTGVAQTDFVVPLLIQSLQSNYDVDTWNINVYAAYLDLPANTTMRAPGNIEAIAFQENIMEHIAKVTGQSSVDVRIANLKSSDATVLEPMMRDWVNKTDMPNRKAAIRKYNKENRWKKKGIALSCMSFPYTFFAPYHIILSVFAGDGTVAITHGGIEMGQGINTKVTQVCARFLGIDVNSISVKPSYSLTAPNSFVSAADAPTLAVCYSAQQSCLILLERLKPYRTSDSMPWNEVIAAANMDQVDLCVEYMFSTKRESPPLENHSIYGVTVTEVEVDLLTGQREILQVDLLIDCGRSMNPELDMGQVHGAFIMGLGYWLMEKLIYDESTGKLLTNRTWNYKPPTNKDIPIDFRVTFRKNAPNPVGVLRAKATGEPSTCMAVSVSFAIKNALSAAREDAGGSEDWFDFKMPYTPENILLNSMTTVNQFRL